MRYRRINISMQADILATLDEAAQIDRMTRSAYIREAIALKLELESTVEQEVSGQASMLAAAKRLHAQRMAGRNIREMDPLTYAQTQD